MKTSKFQLNIDDKKLNQISQSQQIINLKLKQVKGSVFNCIENYKKLRKFESYQKLISTLRNQLMIKKSQHIENSQSSIKLSVSDIAELVIDNCDLAIIRTIDDKNTLFINNPDTGLMTSSKSIMMRILSDLSSHIVTYDDGQQKPVTIKFMIDDLEKMYKQVHTKLLYNSSIRDFQMLPDDYVVTLNDVVINLKTNEVCHISDIECKYDIVNRNSFNFIHESMMSEERKNQSIINRQIIGRVMKDWSSEDNELEYLLWQIMYAVLQNDNHDKFFVLMGPGGNGKSTYMELLCKIAGQQFVIRANIHQFGDPNAINEIDMSTKLIIGDDAATNHKISDVATSNLKSIVTCNPFSVAVKYDKNRLILTNAIFLQATNTEISFYENNPAIKSRLIKIDWSKIDFRAKKSELTFDLDKLMQDQSFIDDWVMMCLEKIDYFDEFIIPQSVRESTDLMIEDNDTIKQFMDDIWLRINKFKKIPLKFLHTVYLRWLKQNNPSGGLMKLQTFAKEINKKSDEYQFKIESKNKSRFKNDTTIEMMCELIGFVNTIDLDLSQQSYLESFNAATNEEIDNFIQLNHPIERELTNEEYQLALIASSQRNRLYLKAIYNNE